MIWMLCYSKIGEKIEYGRVKGFLAANFFLDRLGHHPRVTRSKKPAVPGVREYHDDGKDRDCGKVHGRLHEDFTTLGCCGEDIVYEDGGRPSSFFHGRDSRE